MENPLGGDSLMDEWIDLVSSPTHFPFRLEELDESNYKLFGIEDLIKAKKSDYVMIFAEKWFAAWFARLLLWSSYTFVYMFNKILSVAWTGE